MTTVTSCDNKMETFRSMVSEVHKVVPKLDCDQLPKAVVMMLEEVECMQRLYMEHVLRTETGRMKNTNSQVDVEDFEMEFEMAEEDQEEWVPKKSRKRLKKGSKQKAKFVDSYLEEPGASDSKAAPKDIRAVIGLVPDMGFPRKIGEVKKLDKSSLSLGKFGWMPPNSTRFASKKRAAGVTRGAPPLQVDDVYTTDSEKSRTSASSPSSLSGDSQGRDIPFKFPAVPCSSRRSDNITDFDLPADIANYSRHARSGAGVAVQMKVEVEFPPSSTTTSSVRHDATATDPVATSTTTTTQRPSFAVNANSTPHYQAVPVDRTNSFSGSAYCGPLATTAATPSLATKPVSMPTMSQRQCGPVPVSNRFRRGPNNTPPHAGRMASGACPPSAPRPFHRGTPVTQSANRATGSTANTGTWHAPQTRFTPETSNYSVFCVAPPPSTVSPHPYGPPQRQTRSPGVASSDAHYDRFNATPGNGKYFQCSPPWLQHQRPKIFAEKQQATVSPCTATTRGEVGDQHLQRSQEKDEDSVFKDLSVIGKKKKNAALQQSGSQLSTESETIPASQKQDKSDEPTEQDNSESEEVPVSSTTTNKQRKTPLPEQDDGSNCISPEQDNGSKVPEQDASSRSKIPLEQDKRSKVQTQNMDVKKLQMYLSGTDYPKKVKEEVGSPQNPNASSPPMSPSQSDTSNKQTRFICLTDEELITSRSNFRQLPNGKFRVLNKHKPTVLPDGKNGFHCRHSGCGQTFRSQVHCEDHELNHLFPDMECFKCCVEGCGKKFSYRNRASVHLHSVHHSLFGQKRQRKKPTPKDNAKEMCAPPGDCDKEKQSDDPDTAD